VPEKHTLPSLNSLSFVLLLFFYGSSFYTFLSQFIFCHSLFPDFLHLSKSTIIYREPLSALSIPKPFKGAHSVTGRHWFALNPSTSPLPPPGPKQFYRLPVRMETVSSPKFDAFFIKLCGVTFQKTVISALCKLIVPKHDKRQYTVFLQIILQ
jgi:hypothetical protein